MRRIIIYICLLLISQTTIIPQKVSRSVQANDVSSYKVKSNVTIQVIDKEEAEVKEDEIVEVDETKSSILPTTGESWSIIHTLIGIIFAMLALKLKMRIRGNK